MKLKLDDASHVVVQEGKPVYVYDDGREVAFDAPATVAKISQLNGEAKGHREAKEAAEAQLKRFEGIEDPDAARSALATVKNIDDKKLIDAGKADEVKAAAIRAVQDQAAAAQKALEDQIKTVTANRDEVLNRYNSEKIGGAFKGSKFISEKAAIPADFMEARFGHSFKVEDGQVVAYDSVGNKIYSRARPGELADFDEALETLIERYPDRDRILKGDQNGGSGARQTNGNAGGKVMVRTEFNSLQPTEQAARMRDGWTVKD